MESYSDNSEQTPPDFYEESGHGPLDATTDRLFRLVEPARGWRGRSKGREPDVIAVDLVGEDVPEELRGIIFSLSRSNRRGQVALMNYTLPNGRRDGIRPLTEEVASRVADYIDERRSQITAHEAEGETAGQGWVRQMKEIDTFLEAIGCPPTR